jgi:hypothetical protein
LISAKASSTISVRNDTVPLTEHTGYEHRQAKHSKNKIKLEKGNAHRDIIIPEMRIGEDDCNIARKVAETRKYQGI